MNALTTTQPTALVLTHGYAPDRNPALVYLASLAPASRRPQRQSLQVIADLVQPGTTFDAFPWHQLRYQHTQAVRTQLAARHSATTATGT